MNIKGQMREGNVTNRKKRVQKQGQSKEKKRRKGKETDWDEQM